MNVADAVRQKEVRKESSPLPTDKPFIEILHGLNTIEEVLALMQKTVATGCTVRIFLNNEELTDAYLEKNKQDILHPTDYRVFKVRINIPPSSELRPHVERDTWDTSLNLNQAYSCCAKFYMSGFGFLGKPSKIHSDEFYLCYFKILEIIAKSKNFTYMGFIHQTANRSVEVAKLYGYQPLLEYQNRRGGNHLSEMYFMPKY